MARKSNKTAHVLNLLAGHDAAKDADDQASIESEASGGSAAQTASGSAVPQAAQDDAASGSALSQSASDGTAPQAVSGRQSRQAAPQTAAGRQSRQVAAGSATSQRASGRQARQPGGSATASAAPAPAPVVSAQNNIAVIDKTGDDPVAELIQQKLSSEFEKQMQQSQPKASSAEDITPVSEMDAGSAEDSEYPSDALPLAEAEEIFDDIDLDGLLLSDAEPIASEPEQTTSVNEINADTIILDEDAAEAFDDISGADSFTEQEDESLILSAAEPLPESTLVSQPVTVQEAAVSPQPDQTPAAAPEATPVQEATPISQSASEPAVSAPAPLPTPEPAPEPEPDFAAINVMEHIVRDKIIYFMRQFDVCTCDRCKADVTALTLNGLMPKYIVTTKAAVDPLLSYYTNRLISDVTVEATKSCMIVKENPRH